MPIFSTPERLQIYVCPSRRAIANSLEQAYLAMMPADIRAAIRSYKRWQDRQAALFGKLLLLRALQTNDREHGARRFRSMATTGHGKPFVPGGPEFNISHTEEMVVLAVVSSGVVGIDIEKVRPVRMEDYSGHLPELGHLPETYPADRVLDFFFDCWTQKEAVLKAHGTGLLSPLAEVVLEEAAARFKGTRWYIHKLPIEAGYRCHVATDRPPVQIAVEQVDLSWG